MSSRALRPVQQPVQAGGPESIRTETWQPVPSMMQVERAKPSHLKRAELRGRSNTLDGATGRGRPSALRFSLLGAGQDPCHSSMSSGNSRAKAATGIIGQDVFSPLSCRVNLPARILCRRRASLCRWPCGRAEAYFLGTLDVDGPPRTRAGLGQEHRAEKKRRTDSPSYISSA